MVDCGSAVVDLKVRGLKVHLGSRSPTLCAGPVALADQVSTVGTARLQDPRLWPQRL